MKILTSKTNKSNNNNHNNNNVNNGTSTVEKEEEEEEEVDVEDEIRRRHLLRASKHHHYHSITMGKHKQTNKHFFLFQISRILSQNLSFITRNHSISRYIKGLYT